MGAARLRRAFQEIFFASPIGLKQAAVILVVAAAFVWMPQSYPIDWDLNARGFWSDIPRAYLDNPNAVYPPWGLILMVPYYLMQPVGARVLSVITIGWLAFDRDWPLSRFLSIVLSPYFLMTMTKSGIDIFVMVLPVLLWEISAGRRWSNIGRGVALASLLLKPQCTILMVLYLLGRSRRQWKDLLVQAGIVGLIVIPISFVGSPPLWFQWMRNLTEPSAQNRFFWSINNVSLTTRLGFAAGAAFLILVGILVHFLRTRRLIGWGSDQRTGALLLSSMFLMPYTSQQSLSGGLAFIPSWIGVFLIGWAGVAVQLLVFGTGDFLPDYSAKLPVIAFSVSLLCLLISAAKNQPDRRNA